MAHENFLWLAGLIAAHPERKVYGRTRLQKEVKLLQSLGFPTDYSYTIHFYGPYSESLYADIGLLEMLGFVSEDEKMSQTGTPYFIVKACESEIPADVSEYNDIIAQMAEADAIVLELAATYDAYRDADTDHKDALRRLRRKKGTKCEEGREEKALELLTSLGLEAD